MSIPDLASLHALGAQQQPTYPDPAAVDAAVDVSVEQREQLGVEVFGLLAFHVRPYHGRIPRFLSYLKKLLDGVAFRSYIPIRLCNPTVMDR